MNSRPVSRPANSRSWRPTSGWRRGGPLCGSAPTFFHDEDLRYLRFLIPEGARVLELGCGTGDMLAALKPCFGVGIDFSAGDDRRGQRGVIPISTSASAMSEDPAYRLAGLGAVRRTSSSPTRIGSLDDVQATLESLHRPVHGADAHRHRLFFPSLAAAVEVAEWLGWRAKQPPQNVMSPGDVRDLIELADFEAVKSEQRLLSPLRCSGIGRFINRFISMLPGIRQLALRHYVGVPPVPRAADRHLRSAQSSIPARNERGNIEPAVQRMPRFCDDMEIIFVEGHSSDGTWEEMQRVARCLSAIRHQDHAPDRARARPTPSSRRFDAARGDVLMILDADLTMPPEQLPKFWEAIESGKGEFVNGSRLVYPMEDEAMRFLNLIANKFFAIAFTWLVQPALHRHAVRHQGAAPQRLRARDAGQGLFRRLRSVRRLRPDFRRRQAQPEVARCADPLCGADLWRDADLAFPPRLMLIRMVIFAFFRIKAL